MKTVFELSYPTLAILDDARRFPVARIFCVGRNYAAHAKEMGADMKQPPFFFMKPLTALLPVDSADIAALAYPQGTQNYHYEAELVVALRSGGRDISASNAAAHIFGFAIGLDMTRRDLQKASAEKQQPWELGKTADFSAPVAALSPLSVCGSMDNAAITLKVNDELRQNGTTADMIWNTAELISTLSKFYTLQAGDLIFTGTPEGVGPVVKGDRIAASVSGLSPLNMVVT